MLSGGDEIARSQRGNNNCYCQDNELTWHDWELDEARIRVRDFTSQLIRFRLDHPNLHRRKFFQDREIRRKGEDVIIKDVAWFNTDGNQVSDEVWSREWNRSVAVLLNGRTLQVSDEDGEKVIDDSFFLVVNAAPEGVEYVLPASPSGRAWCQVIDTEDIEDPFTHAEVEEKIIVGGRALKLVSDGAVSSISASSESASSSASGRASLPERRSALV